LLRYALLRLLGAIPTLLLVIVLAFLMVHAAPGGPFDD
jgi:oligopeptide transport system permease protein